MTTFDDFKVGQRVAHISCGDGTVTAVDDSVHVEFDRRTTTGRRKGTPWIGQYDRRWFELHPGLLFHRSEAGVP